MNRMIEYALVITLSILGILAIADALGLIHG
jgi:hypothetical protein